MQLVSKISNLCDPDPPTSQTDRRTDGRTDGRHAISIPRYALVHRAVKTKQNCNADIFFTPMYTLYRLGLHPPGYLITDHDTQYKQQANKGLKTTERLTRTPFAWICNKCTKLARTCDKHVADLLVRTVYSKI